MRKSMFKRLVYTPPDSSPRFTSQLNLSNFVQLSIVSLTEQCWRDCWMPHYDATANANTIHFPGLIYCDRTWLLFLGVQVRLLTRCKICFTLGLSDYFSLKSLSLCLKSHMNVPWSVDYKFIVWFKLWIY